MDRLFATYLGSNWHQVKPAEIRATEQTGQERGVTVA
jgi:hypothetical protein